MHFEKILLSRVTVGAVYEPRVRRMLKRHQKYLLSTGSILKTVLRRDLHNVLDRKKEGICPFERMIAFVYHKEMVEEGCLRALYDSA